MLTPPSSNEDSPQSMFINSPQSSDVYPTLNLCMPNPPSGAYLKIIEPPIEKFRFRYKSEMTGTHGSLCGRNSDRSRKQTYPTVQLCNFDERAIIRCSIYQVHAREPNMPHAHRLIKKKGKGEVDDPHDSLVFAEDDFVHTFHGMGIIHTAKKNIIPELVKKKTQLKKEEIARKEGGFRDLSIKEAVEIKRLAEVESKSINLNVVCLRFDAFASYDGILHPICEPIFSPSINNLKSALTGELKIVRMDHCTSPAKGGLEIFILVERVTKKNIKVRFYELDDEDCLRWEDYGKFSDIDVHHQYAIVFKSPPYRDPNIKTPVKVLIELERPSDRAKSEAKEFSYTPSQNIYKPGAKRARPSYAPISYDSSMTSEELPSTINDLCLEAMDLLEHTEFKVTSAEIEKAMSNINSEEFNKMYEGISNIYDESTVIDAPRVVAQSGPSMPATSARAQSYRNTPAVNTNVQEIAMAKQVIENLTAFIKTHPSDDSAIETLNYYLQQENKTNVLHVSIKQNDSASVLFILKMIYVWKQHDYLNVKDDDFLTPLHLATYQNQDNIIANLLACKADVTIGDADENTALHVAVITNASISVFEKLLSVGQDHLDLENNDGNTALNLAIDFKNMRALKLLCRHGADVNKRHKKSGFTPLRFAVEKQSIDFIEYILQLLDTDPMIEDFQGINALQAAMKKENPKLVSLVSDYMKNNELQFVDIKKEIEDSEEEIEEKFSVKLEQISVDDLRDMYSNISSFGAESLDQLANILDRSGAWQNLADLLGLGHLVRSGLYGSGSNSPTKLLINSALETNGDTVREIRDFLENLDETEAVEIIDNMVKSQYF